MRRIVIDPGVLIAARLSPRGAPARLLQLWLEGAFELVVSQRVLAEVGGVLAREKFRRYLTAVEGEAFVEWLASHAVLVEDPPAEHGHTRDPDDDYLVTLARVAVADALVSGDRDLTSIADARPPVLTPAQLVEVLDTNAT